MNAIATLPERHAEEGIMGPRESGRRANGSSKIPRVAEIEQLYPDEWILLEITRDARDRSHVAGRLLAHSRNRDDLDEPYKQFRADHPQSLVYQTFMGSEQIPEDVAVIL
jgi:hypothetical protein